MLTYIDGDLFDHITPGTLIPHVCNDVGAWGAGFVVPLGKRYPLAKDTYLAFRAWNLGDVDIVRVDDRVLVANMVAQHGVGYSRGLPPIRYDALRACMVQVANTCASGYRILCPQFGCGLAGGEWSVVEAMILDVWRNLDVTVVRFGKGK